MSVSTGVACRAALKHSRMYARVLLAGLLTATLAAASAGPEAGRGSTFDNPAHGETAMLPPSLQDNRPARRDTSAAAMTGQRGDRDPQQAGGPVRELDGVKQRGAFLFLIFAAGTGTPG